MKKKITIKKTIEYLAIGGTLASLGISIALCPYVAVQILGLVSITVFSVTRKKRDENDEKKD